MTISKTTKMFMSTTRTHACVCLQAIRVYINIWRSTEKNKIDWFILIFFAFPFFSSPVVCIICIQLKHVNFFSSLSPSLSRLFVLKLPLRKWLASALYVFLCVSFINWNKTFMYKLFDLIDCLHSNSIQTLMAVTVFFFRVAIRVKWGIRWGKWKPFRFSQCLNYVLVVETWALLHLILAMLTQNSINA